MPILLLVLFRFRLVDFLYIRGSQCKAGFIYKGRKKALLKLKLNWNYGREEEEESKRGREEICQ